MTETVLLTSLLISAAHREPILMKPIHIRSAKTASITTAMDSSTSTIPAAVAIRMALKATDLPSVRMASTMTRMDSSTSRIRDVPVRETAMKPTRCRGFCR